ncbi:MAG: aldo/keto reductase [Oscillospiraceae bacterium]|nr:aldo/keto reductase [Oscillospiraceae bacterium]
MIYKPLGKTGKEISAISFGSMRFKPEEYKKDHQICADILLRAHELGVNYFDTAPTYCDSQSEAIVGLALRQIRGKRPYVGTKCALWLAQTANEAYEQVKKSRDTLGVDTIDFYYMWCVRTLDEYQQMIRPGGIYDGLVRAQQDGLIEHICCSTHLDGGDLKVVVDDGKADVILLGYNALNFAFRREGVKACHDAGLGVIVMNPLSGGLIPQVGEQFGFLKSNPAESVVQAALRFVIGQPEISAALPGPSSIAELEECVSAAERVDTVSEETLARLGAELKSELNTLCTSCAYCDKCPVGVPIVKLLEPYNYYLLGTPKEKVVSNIENIWGHTTADARKCIKCGLCEGLCTQRLPIMERLDVIGSW